MKVLKLVITASLLMWATNANAGRCYDVCKVWTYNYNVENWTYQSHECSYAHSLADSPNDVEYYYNTCYSSSTYYTYRDNKYWRHGRHKNRYYRRPHRRYRQRRHHRRYQPYHHRRPQRRNHRHHH